MSEAKQRRRDEEDEEDDEQEGNQGNDGVPVHKFPRTRHLLNIGGATRDDLLMDTKEIEAFLRLAAGQLIVEEKIDGANLGISLSPSGELRFQNRGHFVTSATATQWRGLDMWTQQNPGVYEVLSSGNGHELILFGEWMAFKHSIHYTRLPGYFIGFDIYDLTEKKFFSAAERDGRLEASNIPHVHLISKGSFTKENLRELAMKQKSAFYDGLVEGVYLRVDGPLYNIQRAKIVRTDFLQSDDHWTHGIPIKNIVRF